MTESTISMHDVLGLILGGGIGTRLFPLTKQRAKPAVPFGGKHRLVDVPISNCINSGVRKICVLTQFNTVSLHRHIVQSYHFDRFSKGFVQILAAEQRLDSTEWYQGTADAVRKQALEIHVTRARDVLILSGDHLYRMDYQPFVEAHRKYNADVTIAVQPVGREEASRFGILQASADGRIETFSEKPKESSQLDRLISLPGEEKPYLASMGIYLFTEEFLQRILQEHHESDFGKHIIPAAIDEGNVFAYPFDGYWEDIGTIESFFASNLGLADLQPEFDLYDPANPIYTRARYLPGSRVEKCELDRVLLSDGCILERAKIVHSVVGLRSIINPGAQLTDVVMMGADYYERESHWEKNLQLSRPDIGIGENTVIERAIIDKNARIGRNVRITNQQGSQEYVSEHYTIKDGVVVIPKNAIIPDNTVI